MGKVEKITIKLAMLFIGLSLLFPARVLAAEKNEINEITEKKQIIFLLDASKSMQGDGQWIEAADSACMIASALPKEYEVALLVYNTEIVYEEDFGNINQKTRHALETVELQGYTTPAVALETAADMFDSAAADKRVVFISDGEISLRDQSETETAIRQFENMVDQIAEQGIKIDMFAIPNDKTENEVSYGTKVTSGEQYTVGENQTIEEITAKYLFQTLQIEKIELGEAVSGEGNMTVDLQDTYMQNAKLNLLTLVGDVRGVNSVSDDKIKEINDALLVRSFDEFLEKFEPVVYSYFDANNQKVIYTLKKPETIEDELLSEIHLNRQNDYLKMLMTLVEAKRAEGSINVDFKFEKLTDMISPKKVMDDIRQNRKELQYTYSEYAKLEDGDPKKLDTADKLNLMFEEASVNYNNVMAMLPLAIEDIKTRLLLGDGQKKKDEAPLSIGVLSMDEHGELKILEAPKENKKELMVLDDNANAGLIQAIEKDYMDLNEDGNEYVMSLVARTFCPLASTMESVVDIEKEVANYNSYLEFYKRSKDDFIKTVKPLVEKIMGVWAFFEQYPRNCKGMKPSLVVSNVSNDMLAKSSNIPRLLAYLNTVNAKNDFENTIWYAIVPSVSLNSSSKLKAVKERFKGNENVEKEDVNSMESLVRILDALKDYEVQCFFSYETGDKTTFNVMATEGIEKYETKCTQLIGKPFSEYAIPCIPNFTVIPKDKSGVILDNKMYITEQNTAALSKEKEDVMKIWIDGVYIGAAYVAAGLVAAYQSPDYLKEVFKKNVDDELPGVRFDIESGDHALQVRTTMAKEITGYTNDIKSDINRKNFGFVFSSENAVLKDMNIQNIMVYKARNLLTDGKSYEPIYKTQVTTYIQRVMRLATGDFKQENIVEFFSSKPTSQRSRWMEKKDCINAIIGNGDDIRYSIDEAAGYCTLDIAFNGNVKNLEIEINRVNSEDRTF